MKGEAGIGPYVGRPAKAFVRHRSHTATLHLLLVSTQPWSEEPKHSTDALSPKKQNKDKELKRGESVCFTAQQ